MKRCTVCGCEAAENMIGGVAVCDACELDYLRANSGPYVLPYCRKHLQDDAAGPGYIRAWMESLEQAEKGDLLMKVFWYIHSIDRGIEAFDREFASCSPDFYDYVKEAM